LGEGEVITFLDYTTEQRQLTEVTVQTDEPIPQVSEDIEATEVLVQT